jgi:ABC-2 type transport system permease protein
MPLRAGGLVTGHVVASLLRNLLATGVVIGVALAVGFRPTANVLEWLGALGMVALFILAITWLYSAIGIAAANPTAASGYGFALLFVPYLSSAFVPTDTMPSWLQWIAQNQPITPIIETIRAFLFGRDPGTELWWALGWCALIIAGAYVWAVWLFGRKAGRR